MEKSAHELHEAASQLFNEGKYDDAEPILKNVISDNPKYADVHNKLGVISHLKGHFRQAAEYFKRALELNPGYTEASLNLAITYNDMGEFRKAQGVFALAAQRAVPSPMAVDPFIAGKIANEHYKLGNIYLDLNMNDEAVEQYKKAISLFSRLPDAHTKLGIALRNKGLAEEAIENFIKAKEINRNYGPAWVQLGLSYYMKGMHGPAIEEWENALKQIPDLKEAQAYLGLIKKEEK